MTVAMREEQLLSEVLATIDQSTNNKGEISPSSVVSVIDDICVALELATHQLPLELRRLRAQAQGRKEQDDIGFREESVADTIVMCGLWAG